MKRARVLAVALATISLSAVPGCVTVYSKTEVIRAEEARRPIAFENPQAAEVFQKAMSNSSVRLGGTYVGIPFITFYSTERLLSESARYNDCVGRCDTNQDGLITLAEAQIFSSVKE